MASVKTAQLFVQVNISPISAHILCNCTHPLEVVLRFIDYSNSRSTVERG